MGELRTREESATRADLQLRQRQQDFDEINAERQQIAARRRADTGNRAVRFTTAAMTTPPAAVEFDQLTDQRVERYPAAFAVLQADVDLRRAQLDEATSDSSECVVLALKASCRRASATLPRLAQQSWPLSGWVRGTGSRRRSQSIVASTRASRRK